MTNEQEKIAHIAKSFGITVLIFAVLIMVAEWVGQSSDHGAIAIFAFLFLIVFGCVYSNVGDEND